MFLPNIYAKRSSLGHHTVTPAQTAGAKVSTTTKVSNWTLAFSTVVIPTNKTNPSLSSDDQLRSERGKNEVWRNLSRNVARSSKIAKKLQKTTSRSNVNNKNLNRRRDAKKRSKAKSRTKNVQTNKSSKTVVNNNSTRHTRDYPYSYYQYQYSPSDKLYPTQETNWRREMVPTSVDSYDAYGKQPLYQTQDELASISDQMSMNGNNIETQGAGNEVFSLPIASLVRRTDIPASPHHVSSISIVNDMLPDDQDKGYLTDRDSIPLMAADDSLGYVPKNAPTLQERSDVISQNPYGLSAPIPYETSQQAYDSTSTRNVAMYPADGSRYTLGNFITNLTGVPLSSFASLTSRGKGVPEDQAPTGLPVLIGSDEAKNPLRSSTQQNSVTNGNKPNSSESSLEMDLTDPGHFPNSKDRLVSDMKKFANISVLSNALPPKAAPPPVANGPSSIVMPGTGVSTYQPTDASLLPGGATASSTSTDTTNYEIKNPVNSLYSALNEASTSHFTFSTTPPVTIFPTASKSADPGSVVSTWVQESGNVHQGDIDAPVQNAILPVGNKKEAYTESQSGYGQTVGSKDTSQNQTGKSNGNTMDLPFPARLKLPEPSQVISQILSGLSSDIFPPQLSPSVSYLPSTEQNPPLSITSATLTTTKLTDLPIVTTHYDGTNQEQATTFYSSSTTNTGIDNPTEHLKSVIFQTMQSTAPNIVTDSSSRLTSDSSDTTPNTGIPPTNTLNNNTDKKSDATSYNEVVVSDGNQTYEVTSDSTSNEGTTSSLNLAPTPSFSPTDVPNTKTTTDKSRPTQVSGHISPGTHVSSDEAPKHISPISKPKLKIVGNGSVIALNNNTKTRRPDINQIYKQYATDAKNKAILKAKRLQWLKSGNGM